jgi:hypothetical protein
MARIVYAKIFPILNLFHNLEIMEHNVNEMTKNNIGIIENEEDDCIAAFRPSTEYAKMTWSNGIIKLQKYSVNNVEIIA